MSSLTLRAGAFGSTRSRPSARHTDRHPKGMKRINAKAKVRLAPMSNRKENLRLKMRENGELLDPMGEELF